MVEVFKTDVTNKSAANKLIEQIQEHFDYQVNFDLEDCDKILRVECGSKAIEVSRLIDLLEVYGFRAEIL